MRGRVKVSAVMAGIGTSSVETTRYNRTAVRLFRPALSAPARRATARAAAARSAALAVASTASAASRHCCKRDLRELRADAADRGRGRRQRRDAETDQHARQQRIGGGLTADADGLVRRRHRPCAAIATSASTAGCHGSVSVASSADIRSAAIVYCVRSLVPIDRKSTCSRMRSASSAAAGTSIITPGVSPRERDLRGKALRPRRRWRSSAPSPTARCRCASPRRRWPRAGGQDAGVAVGDADAAHAERGVGLVGVAANFSGLSEPASSVRMTTLWPANASSTSP